MSGAPQPVKSSKMLLKFYYQIIRTTYNLGSCNFRKPTNAQSLLAVHAKVDVPVQMKWKIRKDYFTIYRNIDQE